MSNYRTAPDLKPSDYIILGVATCFIKADGEVLQVKVAEPIPSAALEAILKQVPTSYELAYATDLGQILDSDGNYQMMFSRKAYKFAASSSIARSRRHARTNLALKPKSISLWGKPILTLTSRWRKSAYSIPIA
jgi:hypothetical protein